MPPSRHHSVSTYRNAGLTTYESGRCFAVLTVYGEVDIVHVTRRIAGWLTFRLLSVCRLKEAGETTERRQP